MSSEGAIIPETPNTGGLTGQAASGVVWSVAQKWVIRITGFATIAILTRLLSPSDYGVVAVALSIIPLLQLLADLGFTTYILQAERATQRTLSTVFWYSVSAGTILMLGLIAVAPVVGWMLRSPESVEVLRGMAPVALLVTLGAVPITLLRRRLQFRTIAVQTVIAGGIGQVVAVVLALTGYGVWALVWQTIAFQIVITTLSWITSRWLPSFFFSWSEFVIMARFGSHVVGIELVAMVRLWLENAIIVAALGTSGLGYLNIAQRLIMIAQDLTTSALVPVSLVVFAQIRESIERLKSAYLRAQSVSYMVVAPIMLFIAVSAPWLVPFVFGGNWEPSIAPAAALAVAGILTIGAALDQGLFYGLGRPGVWFAYALVVDIVTVLTTLVLVQRGLLAVTIGFVVVAFLATVVRWLLIAPRLNTQWWRVAVPFLKMLVPAAGAAAAGFAISLTLGEAPNIVVLLVIGFTIVAVYLPLVRITAPKVWGEISSLAMGMVRRFRRGSRGVRA